MGLGHRQFSCDTLAPGLSSQDCDHMAAIGMFAQGRNAVAENGRIWIGADGANTFVFINAAGVPVTVIVWSEAAAGHDDAASFMNARQPEISYSLPETGGAVEVAAADGVAGGFSALYNRSTRLTPYGQISNTLGEFSTGPWATVDVSQLVDMEGRPMTVLVFARGPRRQNEHPLCVADLQTCVFTCRSADAQSCGAAGTYKLVNCDGPNAEQSADVDGNPTGGCHGWSNGGRLEIVLL